MSDLVDQLRTENARLVALLKLHDISSEAAPAVAKDVATLATSECANDVALQAVVGIKATQREKANPTLATSKLSSGEKIALFSRLFRGRLDVFPVRWESKQTGKSGYAPACANEWRAGICEKPRIKCSECSHRLLRPMADSVIFDHLSGRHTVGVYPLLEDDSCYLLAVDFDEAQWQDDARGFAQSAEALGVPVALEISRSGRGAHVWIFFESKVAARDARRLGSALISHTCAQTRQLELKSYDRLFPNQDTLPKGGFGNLIALPLQKMPRENGHSVFVDSSFQAYPDQWAFLAQLTRMPAHDIEPVILKATGRSHPLDVSFIDDEDFARPWKVVERSTGSITPAVVHALNITLANQVFIEKSGVPQTFTNRLIRLAAFQNPEFYKAQAMRMSVWNTPRIIGCAENYPQHIALPRGCLEAVHDLANQHGVMFTASDERFLGQPLEVKFNGTLRNDQVLAVAAMQKHDSGVLCAPTAFGKTVTAAALIAARGVNTLILVHRSDLLNQWRARLQLFLGASDGMVGSIGAGKAKLSGKIDIALMQSLSRKGEVNPLVENYGHVIVDECHHVGAVSFDALLKRVRAKFVLGLTATPMRRDGQQPIIFMQCGPIRHRAAKAENAPDDLQVVPQFYDPALPSPLQDSSVSIQALFQQLATDASRTLLIAAETIAAHAAGRKILLLTERTEHLESIRALLAPQLPDLFVLHGRMPKKQRSLVISKLEALAADAPRVLLATGKLVGEGFDHPPLDTLLIAMPVSWKGTLQQYAGRLHREHAGKTNVRIIDFVDTGNPMLQRMWEKRQRGYRAMGYRIAGRLVQDDD